MLMHFTGNGTLQVGRSTVFTTKFTLGTKSVSRESPNMLISKNDFTNLAPNLTFFETWHGLENAAKLRRINKLWPSTRKFSLNMF